MMPGSFFSAHGLLWRAVGAQRTRSPCLGWPIGRVGAWPTPAVEQVTRLLLLRLRHQLTTHARRERLLLAEV